MTSSTAPSLRDVLLADLMRQWRAAGSTATPSSWSQIARSLGNHKYLPVVLVRLARAASDRRLGPVAKVLSFVNQAVFGVEAAIRSDIGPGLYFPHTGGIVLGAARIGSGATIYHGVTLGAAVLDVAYTESLRPTLGDEVVVASGAKVLGGVTLGDGAVVGANAVVVKDVEPYAVVGGIPAAFIKHRDPQERW